MCQLLTLKVWGPHREFLENVTSFGLIELKPATAEVHLMLVQDQDVVVVGAFVSFPLFLLCSVLEYCHSPQVMIEKNVSFSTSS